MADPEALAALEGDIQKAQEAVAYQGDSVRSLKASAKEGKADKADVDAAIAKLAELRLALDEKQKAYASAAGGKASSLDKEAFRATLADALQRRLFYLPSFRIYGSVAGFYDYGPPGCAIKQNLTAAWRQHFVLEEGMLEVECPAVTPEAVLKASGHVDRFTDAMVKDEKTGDCYRADHLLEAALEAALEGRPINKPLPGAKKAAASEPAPAPLTGDARAAAIDMQARVGELGCAELGAALSSYGVLAPDTGNAISQPFPFNLMFRTSIGPRGDLVGYLRPETAQGIFVNFRDLLYFNGGKLPFAAAQIGNSYRNEISPRAGLLRVREFTQAEIEHFVNPDDKSHAKFGSVAGLKPLLYGRAEQMGADKKARPLSLGEAVAKKIIANETLAYFIGRTWLFFQRVGVDPARMRFRQHLQHEMAHYAEDCWDAEVETTYGWVECAGLADRSAYDLTAHSQASGTDLSAHEVYSEPRTVESVVVAPNKKEVGVAFKKDAKAVCDALEAMDEACALRLKAELESGKDAKGGVDVPGLGRVELTAAMASVSRVTKKVSGRKIVPSVIEPSFGIGRILYCVFEHAFYERGAPAPAAAGAGVAADAGEKAGEKAGGDKEDKAARSVFRFTPLVAPIKATVFPLLQRPALNNKAQALSAALTREGLSSLVDTTGVSIGRRYARTDELGVPFAVTVDYASVAGEEGGEEVGAAVEGGGDEAAAAAVAAAAGTVTVRERDSMAQVRVPAGAVARLLRRLVDGDVAWAEVAAKYPAQAAAAEK